MVMHFRTIIVLIVLLFIFVAGGYITSEKGGHIMAMSNKMETVNKDIPKMDIDTPSVTETATFALG
jgi:hypothetical protein